MLRVIESPIKNKSLVLEKRRQILDGALRVFRKKGFQRATMREIARESGVTIGSLYNYITKKTDILFLAHEEAVGRISAAVRDCIDGEGDLLTRFRKGIETAISLNWEFQNEIVLMYHESGELAPEDLAIILDMERSYVGTYEQILKRGMEEGIFRQSDAFVLANLFTLVFAVVALKRWNLKGRSIEAVSETLVDFVVTSLLADRAGMGGEKS